MPAPEIIHQLVARFEENREAYHSGRYNEAQLRQEFVDKFFEALGWDIYNRNDFSPEYRDVVVEDSLQIEGASKAPDYAFKIGKERKFYVEAKKPSVDIKGDIHPAYQLKRYAWNAHLPLSILTDFEEFAVYNCKNKPNPGDSAATGRDKFYRYTDYVEKWDEIAGIFSREAVWKGSFDRFAESSRGKKGTTEVDDAILGDIETWRKLLALNIALRNPQVADEHQLNYAVQMTIDRILFLRICEDRGIEPEEQFKNMTSHSGIYTQMVELFRRADVKYNSGLFHFNKEKGNDGAADTFTPGLMIDDRVLKEIIASIYYPCPYIFKEIPVEILGQVYEQFLGKVIRLTAGHQARVEEKPEVRKAGGVYYTPKYIVDYIVQNTVGKLLEGRTPVEAAELKIVDPACGSGSFLLGAYQHLLDWHVKWYTEHDPEKWAKGKNPAVMAASGGGWKLTTAKKKEILVNNIHGVDIDAQAVEVTKLSLLLKVLEAESGQMSLGLERVLPDLGKNIQCGNSLIGEDYFEGRLTVDDEERHRVNPFEWSRAFPQVFKAEKPTRVATPKTALPPELLNRCRELRKNATDAENLLWQLLRDRQLDGLKFRRQQPMSGYILDFYCHEKGLAVELDGGGHLEDDQSRHDEQRTRDLEALGVRVLRMWNHDVLREPQAAMLAILQAADPHPGPLPGGEGSRLSTASLAEEGGSRLSSPCGRGVGGEGFSGGFDAVIGNPPYVRQEGLGEFKSYFQQHYHTYHGMADLYTYFIERGIMLLRPDGYFCYIVANKWMRAAYGEPLRRWLKTQELLEITDFGDLPVFEQATTYPCILRACRGTPQERFYAMLVKTLDFQVDAPQTQTSEVLKTSDVSRLQGYVENNRFLLAQAGLEDGGWTLTDERSQSLMSKLKAAGVPLGEYVGGKIYYGIKTGLNEAFVIDAATRERLIAEDPKSADLIKPFLIGKDIKRYKPPESQRYIILIRKGWTKENSKNSTNTWRWLQQNYPAITKYLEPFAQAAGKRFDKGDYWWELRACDYYCEFEKPKITWGNLATTPKFYIDYAGYYINAPSVIISSTDLYLIGILNSTISYYVISRIAAGRQGGFYEYKPVYVSKIPIHTIDFTNHTDVKQHDRMVALVERMLELHKRTAQTPQEQERLTREIQSTDREIDKLVYELYGLTEEEIRIVEG